MKAASDAGTVLLLSGEGTLARALRHATAPVFVAAVDEAAAEQARTAGLPHALLASLPQPSKETLLHEVDAAARRWYRPGGVDVTDDDGLSLGELFYVEVGYDVLFPVAQRIALVEAVMQHAAPARWVVATAQDREWIDSIRLALGTKADVRGTGRRLLPRWSRIGRPALVRWVRAQGLDRWARELAFAARRLTRRRTREPAARPVLFVVDIPVPSVMETILPVARAVPADERLLVATDPRCLDQLEAAGLPAYAFTAWELGLPRPTLPFGASARRRAALERIRAAGQGLHVRGVDLWPAVGRRLLRLLRRRLAIAARHRRLAEAALRAWRVEVVVTASDSHYSGQLFVLCGKRVGVRSVNVQHGLFGEIGFGYLPARATRTAVMGEAVRELYLAAGIAPEAVVATGLPRLDALCGPPGVGRDAARAHLGFGRAVPLCLFAPDPVAYGPLGDWMWAQLARFLADETLDVLVRPHPADGLDAHEAAAARVPPGRHVRVSRWPDSGSALAACDALVCALSTLALEALIVDRPVILLLPDPAAAAKLHYVREGCVAVATTAEELRRAWSDALDPQAGRRLQERRRLFLERYACGADGRSAGRVRDLVGSLRTGARAQP
jgi:hypothetical protein